MGRWQREALTEGLMTQRRCPSTTRFASGPPPHRCATGGSATTVPHPPRPPHLAASRPDDYSRSMSDAKIFISANDLLADSLRLGMQEIGRASWRERVCQEVYIWGCAVSLKHKSNIENINRKS